MPHRTPLRMLFPPVPAFPLQAGQAALLVLDYQPFMTDRRCGLGRNAAERGIERELDEYYQQVEYGVRNTTELVQAFRAAGQPIVFTCLAAPPAGHRPIGLPAYGGTLPDPDGPEAQIVGALAPAADRTTETVLRKHTLSPFASTPLDTILGERGTRYLVLAGVMTGWAVELTAREAVDRGYGVLVVSDACPGETYEIHDFVMAQLYGGAIRARSTGAVLEMLAGRRT